MKDIPPLIIFTDLDGTLLDSESYSFEDAKQALEIIRKKDIPLIFSTSKSRDETIYYRKLMENNHPFIVENGGGIYIPFNYFNFELSYNRKWNGYIIIELGMPIKKIRELIHKIRDKNGWQIKGFGDMDVEEVMNLTSLPYNQAKLAIVREYDEPAVIHDRDIIPYLRKELLKEKLNLTIGGRFIHIHGDNDKGKAMDKLVRFYKRVNPNIKIIALGDSDNDLPMLKRADIPIVIKRKDGTFLKKDDSSWRISPYPAPKGWACVIEEVLEDLNF